MSRPFKILKSVVYCALVLLALLALSYFLSDPEPRQLNAQTRAGLPGSFAALDDGVVHYDLVGPQDGRTVVLVHGGGLCASDAWTPVADSLVRAGYRVLLYDLYGQGYSDRPKAVYNPDLFDRQLNQLISRLGISAPVDLVGHSMGGLIAATYAARHPERVRSLTLVAPAGLETHLGWMVTTLSYPLVGEYVFRVLGRKIASNRYGSMQHAPKYAAHVLRDDMVFLEFDGSRRALLSVLRNMPIGGADVFERVGRQSFPVLAIFGRYDTTVPPSAGDRLKRLVPRLEVREIDNASHGLVYDNAEEVSGLVINLLRSSS